MTPAGLDLFDRWHRSLRTEADYAVAVALTAADGDLDEDDLVRVLVAVVLTTARRQSAAVEVMLRDLLTIDTGKPVASWGIDETPAVDRIEHAIRVAVAREGAAVLSTIRRIVHHESTTAARMTLKVAMAKSGEVVGWTRATDADPCKLCASLVGPVLGLGTQMITHPGCACAPMPVLRGDP